MEEKTIPDVHAVIQSPVLVLSQFSETMAARGDSPSRRAAKILNVPNVVKNDDLDELDEDDDGDEMVQEVEPPVEDTDTLTDTAGAPAHLWTMDWGDLDQERRNFRKRPALDDLPDEVREELASMSGAEIEIRPKQKPKFDPADIVKESSRGRKSPADEEGKSPADISVLLSKPAKTAEERLAVLEARDKLIRIRSNQQLCPQLKNVGKCPDMCPEKERYQRIARHQVDYYEYNRDTKDVNHACMIKIYARSSADQQMPLPHDLRPVNVLWMTMSYLVSQFADLADSPGENLGEWYHFLWDRMRSIRKDITQLALCDIVSVHILEMCARFHIFCMERLREEKMAVFDEKINRENLTKCLQSLQYMYNDLFLKNVSCPNEPEFQAFSILLHINSDLCTSTILGLRPEMRQHEKVKFAINAFLAVTMKNYVRFFKLVKSTTYLNACILHQYFAQVRAHAMHSIIRAYSRQKMRNIYPLSELQEQLLFDSLDDVLEFCKFSKVPVEESNIILEKNTAHPIPMQEKMKRSFVGVECKRQSSIKEIVAGGCQLANSSAYHKVHDSFDEQGILKQEAWYADDQDAAVLLLSIQDRETSSNVSTMSSSSVNVRSNSRESLPLQDAFSSVTTPLFVTTQSSMSLTQNSGVTSPHKSIFGVSKISPISQSLELSINKSEELNNIPPTVTAISDSTVKHTEQESGTSDLMSPSHTSSTFEQFSVHTDSFVFRLPDAKLESKDDNQRHTSTTGEMQSTMVLHSSPSIFGGSYSAMTSESSGLSMSSVTYGQTVFTTQTIHSSSGYWGSTAPPLLSANSTHNSKSTVCPMETSSPDKVVTPSSSALEFPFDRSIITSSTKRPVGLFVPGGTNFWGPNISPSTKELSPPVSNVSPSIDHFGLAVTSALNQFPVSVYGLTSQSLLESSETGQRYEPIVSQSTFSHVPTGFPSSPDYSQNLPDSFHVTPHTVTRAVTVPTSIFGLHSRPLSTPQMFPTSVDASSIIVSSHSAPCTPGSLSSSMPVTENNFIPETGGFLFPSDKTNTNIAITTSYSALFPSSSSDKKCLGSSAQIAEEQSLHDITRGKSELQKHISPPIVHMEVDFEDNIEDADQFIFKPVTRSPVSKSLPAPLPSPSRLMELKRTAALHVSKDSSQKRDENNEHKIHELVGEMFRKWRLLTYRSKLKHRLQSQEVCPPLVTSLSLEEQVCELPIPQGCVAIDFQTRLEYLVDAEEMKISQSIFPDVGKIKVEEILKNVLPKALLEKGKFESSMFWKLTISLPDESEGKKYSLQLHEWVEATFSGDSEEHTSQGDLLRVTRTQLGEEYNLFTSVQRIVGPVNDELKGVCGLWFFTPRNMKDVRNSYERYQTLIDASSAHFPLPLVAVVCNSQWTDVCHEWFMADYEKGRIEAFRIIFPFQGNDESASKELTNSISWLTQYIIPAPPFEQWPFREVLPTLMTDLWTRVRYSLASRCSFGQKQHPEDLLGLYHDALEHLHNIVVNDKLDLYGNNPPELEALAKNSLGNKYISRTDLKSAGYIKKIREAFLQFQLNIKIPFPEKLCVESLCESVCSYNSRLRGPISHFLCQRNNSDDTDWTCVVEELSEIHIRDTIGQLKLKNLILVFNKSELHKFRMEPWYTLWLQDRLTDQERCIAETEKASDSKRDTPELDSSVNCKDSDTSVELNDPAEKLFADFESMLNELEKINKTVFLNDDRTNLTSSQPLEICDSKYDELDIFESQLEKYEELLKD